MHQQVQSLQTLFSVTWSMYASVLVNWDLGSHFSLILTTNIADSKTLLKAVSCKVWSWYIIHESWVEYQQLWMSLKVLILFCFTYKYSRCLWTCGFMQHIILIQASSFNYLPRWIQRPAEVVDEAKNLMLPFTLTLPRQNKKFNICIAISFADAFLFEFQWL